MTEVTLRELMEQKICALDKRIDDRFIALDKALALQAEKDSRHFADLNHEQARLLSDRERYLPRETYAADRRDRAALWVSILSLIIALLTLLSALPK